MCGTSIRTPKVTNRRHAVDHRDKRASGFGDEADLDFTHFIHVVTIHVVTLLRGAPIFG